MDPASIDAVLVQRVNRSRSRPQSQPQDVGAAVTNASKQFQLWEVRREEAAAAAPKREAVSIPKALAEAPQRLARGRPAATAELVVFVSASAAAKRAFRGVRALVRSILAKPFK